MEVIGTTTWMWDDSREGGCRERLDAYRDISGRATQEAKAEHVLEVEKFRTNIWIYSGENVWNKFSNTFSNMFSGHKAHGEIKNG